MVAKVGFFFTNHREVKDPGRPSCYSQRGRVTFWGVFNIENEGFRLWGTGNGSDRRCARRWNRQRCGGVKAEAFELSVSIHDGNEKRGTFDHDRCGQGVAHCPALAQIPYPYFLVDGTRLYGRRKCPLNPWSCWGIMLNARYEHFHRRRAGIFFRLKVISFGFILTSLTNRGFEFRSKLRTISGMSPK